MFFRFLLTDDLITDFRSSVFSCYTTLIISSDPSSAWDSGLSVCVFMLLMKGGVGGEKEREREE